ncbi:ComEA family DNA-binding protein [Tamlana crocina]|uniref:Helix-hairpin-helix domain-containing protein n=1 Tax=Tamlana crocina TaxID=393006 RepID=A0ABX1D8I2_9FLAO|nr:helix-hairpin-helix domain-containing protein [Tamlana crocina]NJX14672.1 helix-hairpin-helix domain-containing protein [Tamlana crocina]
MKSHFKFSKEQRNGIFLLLLLIIALQSVYFYVVSSKGASEELQINENELLKFTNEIDSLRQIEIENSKPKIYPFNPNYITDYKGSTLGMSNEEIDRLLNYRKQNKWINSAKQFQEVTQVSDSLLEFISPYFKFPDWVENPKPKTHFSQNNKPKTYGEKQDLNTVTAQQLQKVNGVGKVISERIVKFRNKHVGGFLDDVQLNDVYGLTPEVVERIKERFTVKTPSPVKKLNLNTAVVSELVTVPHIDYDLAAEIVEQRQLREGFESFEDLNKVNGFPSNKIEIIKLYLHLEKQIDE